jgi:channel protein (hemolysin III family)
VLFAALTLLLLRRTAGQRLVGASILTLGIASVFLLSMSGTYHLLSPGAGRQVLDRLDVGAIFFLVAGTYTPVHIIVFRGLARWGPLVLIWSAAITGAALRTVFFGSLPAEAGTGLFLVLGWAGVVSGIVLWRSYGYACVQGLLAGGIAYTAGALVLTLGWPTLIPRVVGPHELWHLAVLGGLSLHWSFVLRLMPQALSAAPSASWQRLPSPRSLAPAWPRR